MPLSNFNVHFIRVINPDNPATIDFVKCKKETQAFRPQDAEQQVREEELRRGFGFIRGKVKVDLRAAYAKRRGRQ